MIGKTLKDVLNEKNVNVNELAKMINVSNQTLYSIIKRNNMKIDFEILLKICSALNVNIERFYSDYLTTSTPIVKMKLDKHEEDVITAYRNQPSMQAAVDRLLNIPQDGSVHTIYRAANSKQHSEHTIEQRDEAAMRRLADAPKVKKEEDL